MPPGILLGLLLSGCNLGSPYDPCDDDNDPAYLPGLYVTGFSLGSEGRGYLSTLALFGDCLGVNRVEGRVYAVDMVTETTEPIAVDFLPGRVVSWGAGDQGLIMGSRLSLFDDDPGGIATLRGNEIEMLLPLTNDVEDIQPAPDGWIVSAGDGGSFHVEARVKRSDVFPSSWPGLTGAVEALGSTPSYCGAAGLGAFLVCREEYVAVLSTASLAEIGSFPVAAQSIAATAELAVFLHGTAASVSRGSLIEQTFAMEGPGYAAWISADSQHIMATGASAFWIRMQDLSTSSFGPFADVAFSGEKAVNVYGHENPAITDLVEIWSELLYPPPPRTRYSQIETLADGRVVLASTMYWPLTPGDLVPNVFRVYDPGTDTWGVPWGLVVE